MFLKPYAWSLHMPTCGIPIKNYDTSICFACLKHSKCIAKEGTPNSKIFCHIVVILLLP